MLLYYGDFNFNIASVWLDKHIESINIEVHSVCVCLYVCVYIYLWHFVWRTRIFSILISFLVYVSGGREGSQSLATCKMYNNFIQANSFHCYNLQHVKCIIILYKLTHFIATIWNQKGVEDLSRVYEEKIYLKMRHSQGIDKVSYCVCRKEGVLDQRKFLQQGVEAWLKYIWAMFSYQNLTSMRLIIKRWT